MSLFLKVYKAHTYYKFFSARLHLSTMHLQKGYRKLHTGYPTKIYLDNFILVLANIYYFYFLKTNFKFMKYNKSDLSDKNWHLTYT